jgi:hypothetical protein
MTMPPVYIIGSIWLFETALVWVELAFVLGNFTIYRTIPTCIPDYAERAYRAFRGFLDEAALPAFLMLIMFGRGVAIGGRVVEPDESVGRMEFRLFHCLHLLWRY